MSGSVYAEREFLEAESREGGKSPFLKTRLGLRIETRSCNGARGTRIIATSTDASQAIPKQ